MISLQTLETFKEVYKQNKFEELWFFIEKCYKMVFTLEDLPFLFEKICSTELEKQHWGAIGLRIILESENNMPIQQAFDSNIVQCLIEFLDKDDFPCLQLESVGILMNFATWKKKNIQNIIDKGGVFSLLRILDSKHPRIVNLVTILL